ncbi:MAG: glycine--tRNA ligase subunit beta, partial [Sphingomonadaceae bacterium]|nr:glycine--tRNA ligase subunit beta [Sphingomonadaceae bacterium]
IVREAEAVAAAARLTLIPDAGLVAENAGLTEWSVPLLGRFDPAFLDVPREVLQLPLRTNQKYFALADAEGKLAPAFVAVANLPDASGHIVRGNAKVLAARLADARFFWDADRAVRLEDRLPKLKDIVFHEKLGTVADKVERVAKLARWLVESGAIAPPRNGEVAPRSGDGGAALPATNGVPVATGPSTIAGRGDGPPPRSGEDLAALAETAARLCKADLVSATVGEFPEVQGIAGGHLALAEGLDPQVAAAIRDHYKPVGPSDEVPTAPVTVAVALADKLDTLVAFFGIQEYPTGSRDPFALRRAALGIVRIIVQNHLRVSWRTLFSYATSALRLWVVSAIDASEVPIIRDGDDPNYRFETTEAGYFVTYYGDTLLTEVPLGPQPTLQRAEAILGARTARSAVDFFADRLKVQQREAGIRPDVIDAVFSLGGEDDLVRLVSRAKALQAVLQTPDGASLLAGYRRGANIVRIERGKTPDINLDEVDTGLLTEPAEAALAAALDAAVPETAAAVASEDFTQAMTALARLRPVVDAFFEHVTVNAHEQEVRRNRLALLARLRSAVHTVADFSKLEG